MIKLRISERETRGSKFVVGEGNNSPRLLLAENLPVEIIEKIKQENYSFVDYVMAPWVKPTISVRQRGFYNCRIVRVKESLWGSKKPKPILVAFFVPIKEVIEINWLRRKNKIELDPEDGEFKFYFAFRETNGIEEGEIKYEVAEIDLKINASMASAKFQGIFFYAKGSDQESEAISRKFLPPFSELPEKYRKMAETCWKGTIISPGIWVKDLTRLPTEYEEISGGDNWIKFGPFNDTIAEAGDGLVKKKARLISAKEGNRIYEDEIWEAYYETPFGDFVAKEGRIKTEGIEGQLMVKCAGPLRDILEEDWKRWIQSSDSRVACQFCYLPNGEMKGFHAQWTEVIEGHGHGARDCCFSHDEEITVKICPACTERGLKGELYTIGIWHASNIKLLQLH